MEDLGPRTFVRVQDQRTSRNLLVLLPAYLSRVPVPQQAVGPALGHLRTEWTGARELPSCLELNTGLPAVRSCLSVCPPCVFLLSFSCAGFLPCCILCTLQGIGADQELDGCEDCCLLSSLTSASSFSPPWLWELDPPALTWPHLVSPGLLGGRVSQAFCQVVIDSAGQMLFISTY